MIGRAWSACLQDNGAAMDPTNKFEIWRWLPLAMLVVAVGTAAAIYRIAKVIRETWRKDAVMHGLSWTCHACGEERPDAMIGVHKIDVSDHFHMPPGMAFNNVRYCLDRVKCKADAEKIRWVPPRDPETPDDRAA